MSAFCPVCQRELSPTDLCQHIAVVVLPIDGIPMGMVYQDGCEYGAWEADILGLDALTLIGDFDGALVFFSPNPSVYIQAIHESRLSGLPVEMVYQEAWHNLGMEHERWHDGEN